MKDDLKDLIIDGATVVVDRGEEAEKEFFVSRNIGSVLPWVVGFVIDEDPTTVTNMEKLVENLFTMIDEIEQTYGGRCERATEPLEGYKTLTIDIVDKTLCMGDGKKYPLGDYLDILRRVTGQGLGQKVIKKLIDSLMLAKIREAASE